MCYPVPEDPQNACDFLPKKAEDQFEVHFYDPKNEISPVLTSQNFGKFTNKLERVEIEFGEPRSTTPFSFWGKVQIEFEHSVWSGLSITVIMIGRITPGGPWALEKRKKDKEFYLNLFRKYAVRTIWKLAKIKLSAQFWTNFKENKEIRVKFAEFLRIIGIRTKIELEQSWKTGEIPICLFSETNYFDIVDPDGVDIAFYKF